MEFKQPWMDVAYKYLGTTETPGAGNTEEIMKWPKVIGGDVEKEYTADSIPWCALFMAFCMAQTGIKPVDTPLWALNWAKFGKKLSAPAFGCILVFKRDGGGHVGFYVSEDSSYFHVLGGNQSDMVSITRVAKNRCVSYNWPPGMDKFYEAKRINKVFDGKISTNEK